MRTTTKTVISHTPSQTGSPRVHIFHGSCRNKNKLKLHIRVHGRALKESPLSLNRSGQSSSSGSSRQNHPTAGACPGVQKGDHLRPLVKQLILGCGPLPPLYGRFRGFDNNFEGILTRSCFFFLAGPCPFFFVVFFVMDLFSALFSAAARRLADASSETGSICFFL